MFYGRAKELEALNNLYKSNRFQLFVLYGRRRIGKTALLAEFCKDKDHIFFSAQQTTRQRNLAAFSNQIIAHFHEPGVTGFDTFQAAMEYLDSRQSSHPLVIVLDEFPYYAESDPSVLSALQHLIDHRLKHGNLFLILCGSYVSFMEKEILGEKSPLFGRRTGQLQLQPFNYREAAAFLQNFTKQEQLELYGVFGGIPWYLEQIAPEKTLKENIIDLILSPTGPLYNETQYLLLEELNRPAVYNAILEAISAGATRSNEIAQKTGEEPAKCLKYIQTLIQLGLVEKQIPFGEKATARKSLYYISDPFSTFWFRYVLPNRSLLEQGAAEAVYEQVVKPDFPNHMGPMFERICKQYLLAETVSGQTPFLVTTLGRYWGTGHIRKAEVEIDLVGKGISGSRATPMLFGECKWQNQKVSSSVLEELKEKAAEVLPSSGERYFYLFSKSGFTKNICDSAAQDAHVYLISMEEIESFPSSNLTN